MTATSALKLAALAALTVAGCSRFRRGNDEPVGWDLQTSGTSVSLRVRKMQPLDSSSPRRSAKL